jgi:hypothetical protein
MNARTRLGVVLLGVLVSGAGRAEAPRPAVALHPENPRYFLFRGRPLVLVTATEHYGSVINRAFDFEKYLDDAADKGMTLTRTFLLYRELQTPRNPASPCKPESPDYLAPYVRRGPGKALDGEPAYDLERWNPEYFDRVRRFLGKASRLGIVVELTLFSHTYNDAVWALNPLRAANNKQGVGKVNWPDYDSMRDKALVARQAAYARKIVQETCGFDNVYYEVCNEPAGGVPGHPTVAEVDAWLREMAGIVRDELRRCGRPHLVFGTQAFDVARRAQAFDTTLSGPLWDAVNVHPHPWLHWKDRVYRMGNFMSKELTLGAVRDFCQAVWPQKKPVVLDEDNAASLYRDPVGWTMRRGIRLWLKHLSRFIHSFDFVHARPLPGWVSRQPEHLVASTLAVEGEDYAAYLADAREVTEPGAGGPLSGPVSFALPAGAYRVSLYSPTTGVSSPALAVSGGKTITLELPPFRHDVVLRATRSR